MNRLYKNKENSRRKLFLQNSKTKAYIQLDNYEAVRYLNNVPKIGDYMSSKDFRILASNFKLLQV